MFRCYIGRGSMSTTDLETRIDDWVSSNVPWSGDTVAHTLRQRNTETDGSGTDYHSIDVRFELDNSKSNLLQKFEDKLQNKVAWYRLAYHSCGHDDENGGPCSFDPSDDPEAMAREWTDKDVTIPSGVPEFPSEAYSN